MKKHKLVINGGHGGAELGAISSDGSYEKNINLEVVLHLKELLKPYSHVLEPYYTRLIDIEMSLEKRIEYANKIDASLYVSIHHNSYNKVTHGAETIHSIVGGEGERFAKLVMEEFMRLGQSKRRVFSRPSKYNPNKDYYYELRYTNMPAVITEYAFIDGDDYKDIDTSEERLNEAQAILNAILTFYNIEPIKTVTGLVRDECLHDRIEELEKQVDSNRKTINRIINVLENNDIKPKR